MIKLPIQKIKFYIENCKKTHMMRFTAFPEIQLNAGMRDIGDCRWAKATYCTAVTPTHPQGIYVLYLSCLGLIEFPGKP